ncbi:MAG TPA: glycosyltransferase, partial [Thermoanaerobaculia bacterium]|nr:glycosyltransferase [Thermoanaerobaculia bacterium]
EICAAGRPSVLVPLSIAQGHQLDNARMLEETGGARVLPSSDFSAERLAELVGELLADGARLSQMATAARSLAKPRAVQEIADRLEELGGRG